MAPHSTPWPRCSYISGLLNQSTIQDTQDTTPATTKPNLYPCDLVLEGKDQNEIWFFGSSMVSSNAQYVNKPKS